MQIYGGNPFPGKVEGLHLKMISANILKMKKLLLLLIFALLLCGFKDVEVEFSLDDLKEYQKEYVSEEVDVCSTNKTKTYMDYRAITDTSSTQYKYIRDNMVLDEQTGFLVDEDGFIGVALGSYYGVIGDRYYFTLDSGVVLPLVKVEEKADGDTNGGCYHYSDGSVIEFVIDKDAASEYFGSYSNGLVLSGNYNNYSLFNGEIAKVEKVADEKKEDYVTYVEKEEVPFNNDDIFDYASGY